MLFRRAPVGEEEGQTGWTLKVSSWVMDHAPLPAVKMGLPGVEVGGFSTVLDTIKASVWPHCALVLMLRVEEVRVPSMRAGEFPLMLSSRHQDAPGLRLSASSVHSRVKLAAQGNREAKGPRPCPSWCHQSPVVCGWFQQPLSYTWLSAVGQHFCIAAHPPLLC